MKKILKSAALIICFAILTALIASCGAAGDTANRTGDTATVTDRSEDTTIDTASDSSDANTKAQNAPVKPKKEFSVKDADRIYDEKRILVGVDENYPMSYRDQNGEWTGFDVEFAKAFANFMEAEAEFVEVDRNNITAELEAGRIDCFWSGTAMTAEAKESADFSVAYAVNRQVIVAKKDNAAEFTDLSAISSNVAVCENSFGRNAALDAGLAISEYPAEQDVLTLVRAGSFVCGVVSARTAAEMIGEGKEYSGLAEAFVLKDESYAIAYRKDSDLKVKFNDAITAFNIDGTLPGLADKYGVTLAD